MCIAVKITQIRFLNFCIRPSLATLYFTFYLFIYLLACLFWFPKEVFSEQFQWTENRFLSVKKILIILRTFFHYKGPFV